MTSSLTGCLKKAGSALPGADRAAILARARDLRGEGRSAHAAAKQAVQERLELVRTELNQAVRSTLKPTARKAGGQEAVDVPAAARDSDTAQRRSDEPMPSGRTLDEARAEIRRMRGARAADVQLLVNELTSKWKDGPKVTVVQTTDDLPGTGIPADVRGLYQKGEVWIVAGAHKSGPDLRRAVARTLGHEAIAHYGLRQALGRDGWTSLMRDIQLGVKAGNKELRRLSDYVRKTYVDEDGEFNLSPAQEADEIAAKAVEEAIDEDGNFKPGYGFLKAVFARVAQFLRDLGIMDRYLPKELHFTNAELQGMLVLSMRNMERGERTVGGGQLAVAAAREDGPMLAVGESAAEADPFDGAAKARTAPVEDEADVAAAPAPQNSASPTSPWRDATGRLQFAPGAWLYEKLGAAAGPWLTKLQMKAASPKLRRALREMKLQVQKAQDTAGAVATEAMKLSEAERNMVSDLVEQELAAGTVPPAHALRLAAMINTTMGAQTDELVRLGMLTEDSAELWRGKYLPRYYKNKLGKQVGDAWADAVQKMFGRTRAMAGIKGKHLRGRGLYENVQASEVPDWESLGWEVRDADYPGASGSEISQKILADEIGPDDTVQVWRDFTREERDGMGEIRDAGFRFVMGYMQTQKDIALGRLFEQLAGDAEMSAKKETAEFTVRVPDGTVTGTGAKKYGKLAGRWVSKDTFSHLSQIEESQSEAWQMYRKALAIWKEGKVVLNPVSHVNNIVSNLTMAHFAGVSYLRADKYIGAARDFATSAAGVKEAKDAGLFLGTMSDAELMNVLPEDLKALVKQQDSAAKKIGSSAFNVMTFFLRRPMGWAYQAEDTYFRYLIYKDARDRGMELGDAVDYAQKYIFAYDDLPKGARMIRDFGIPFFAYTYKAIPALLHTALTHPVRMAAPAAVLWGINAAAYAIAAGDDEDDWLDTLQKYLNDADFREKVREKEKLERENLPPWMKGSTSLGTPKAIRLGMDEVTKLPLFIDTARIVPGGDLFDINPNGGGIPWIQPLTPSNPLLTTYMAMFGNKDAWFGKEIVDSNDTRGEAAAKRAEWLWKQATPAVAIGNYHFERGMNALAQASGGEVKWLPDAVSERYTGIGRDGLPVQPAQAAAQTFGIKIRPMDLDRSEAIGESLKNKMIRDIDTEMRSLLRLNQIGAVSDKTYDRKNEESKVKKARLQDGLTVDGDKKD